MKRAKEPQVYRLIQCSGGEWYVIPSDEEVTFLRWCLAKTGKRHMPAHFEPVRVKGPTSVVFGEWREET